MVMDVMLDTIIRVGLVIATAFLFGIVFLAYLRVKNTKMFFVALGFGTFLVNALIHLPELISENYSIMLSENLFLFIHLVGLLFIAVGILKD
jgi:hypothetical protein